MRYKLFTAFVDHWSLLRAENTCFCLPDGKVIGDAGKFTLDDYRKAARGEESSTQRVLSIKLYWRKGEGFRRSTAVANEDDSATAVNIEAIDLDSRGVQSKDDGL